MLGSIGSPLRGEDGPHGLKTLALVITTRIVAAGLRRLLGISLGSLVPCDAQAASRGAGTSDATILSIPERRRAGRHSDRG